MIYVLAAIPTLILVAGLILTLGEDLGTLRRPRQARSPDRVVLPFPDRAETTEKAA